MSKRTGLPTKGTGSRLGVLLAIALGVILGACRTSESPSAEPAVTTIAAEVAGTAITPATTTATTTTAKADSTPPTDATTGPGPSLPAAVVRAQFEFFVAGDLVDPCSLEFRDFEPPPTTPAVFFGPEANYWGDESLYRIGWSPSWCITGFEPGVPIQVEVQRPDGGTHELAITLDRLVGAQCRSSFFHCPLSEVLLPLDSAMAPLTIRTLQRSGGRDASVASWFTPGAPLGSYVVTAEQGTLRAETEFVVEAAQRTGIAVAHVTNSAGGSVIEAYFVGFEPGSEVLPALYTLGEPDCALVDCEVTIGRAWTATQDMAPVVMNHRGEAFGRMAVGTRLPPGSYCVVAAETVPTSPAQDQANPCWYLAPHYAGFDVVAQDLGLSTNVSAPSCFGQYVTVLGSSIDPDLYATEIQTLLDAFPGSDYLRTDAPGCPSLRQSVDGNPIYAAYFGPYLTREDACAAVALGPPDAYVKILDDETDPGRPESCP